ncbi:MAG: hypothetical protein ACI8UO_006122 [Verrucomicrobiales bacterium]|jgi:hypothetical protein
MKPIQSEAAATDQVPILIGIIGHRDIPEADAPEIELKLRLVFKRLRRLYPNSPIAAITGLAEGADTIGARAAVAEGLSLIAPLPMPLEEYKETFSSPEKAAEMEGFHAKSLSYVCGSLSGEPDTQEKKFARAGAAVVQYSHLVIALWNGKDSGLDAGASYLIKHALEGIPKDIVFDLEGSKVSPLDPISTAIVRQIPVRREKDPDRCDEGAFPDAPEGKFDQVTFTPRNKAKLNLTDSQKRMFRHFEKFNKVIKRHRPKTGSWGEEAAYPPLVDQASAAPLPEGLQTLRERFAMADHLSLHFQNRRHRRISVLVIILSTLLAFVHQATGMLDSSDIPGAPEFLKQYAIGKDFLMAALNNWSGALYLGLLLLVYAVIFFARLWRWQMHYLDYRTIAEGARIQFFWLIAGIRTPVVNFFLRKQRDELEWIRGVLRLWYLRAVLSGGVVPKTTPEQAALIQKCWIRDQLVWSNKSARRSNRIDRVLTALAMTFLFLLFAAVVARTFLPDGPGSETNSLLLAVAASAAGAIVVLFSTLRYFRAYRETHKSNSRMTVLFSRADQFFDPENGVLDEERAVLEEVGREALAESGDWLLSNRNRER